MATKSRPTKGRKAAPPPAPEPKRYTSTSFLFRHLEQRHRVTLETLKAQWGKPTLNSVLIELIERYTPEREAANRNAELLRELERYAQTAVEAREQIVASKVREDAALGHIATAVKRMQRQRGQLTIG